VMVLGEYRYRYITVSPTQKGMHASVWFLKSHQTNY